MVDDDLDSWHSCNELTLIQAAFLLAGKNPSHMNSDEGPWGETIDGFNAAMTAVSFGLRQGIIEGRLVLRRQSKLDDEVGSIDPYDSTVMVDSLKDYLTSRGRTTGFFFPETITGRELLAAPNYLDPNHPRYAPKLAAAVKAWMAVGESSEKSSRAPKQLLKKWLLDNAANYKLTDDQGIPNRLGIEEVAKVANWKLIGGAPKTRSNKVTRSYPGPPLVTDFSDLLSPPASKQFPCRTWSHGRSGQRS